MKECLVLGITVYSLRKCNGIKVLSKVIFFSSHFCIVVTYQQEEQYLSRKVLVLSF